MGEFSHEMTAADLNVFQHVQRFPEFVRGSGACQPREFVGQQDKIPVSGEHQALPADFHHGDVGMRCQDFDFVGVQQVAHRFRRGAEAVGRQALAERAASEAKFVLIAERKTQEEA